MLFQKKRKKSSGFKSLGLVLVAVIAVFVWANWRLSSSVAPKLSAPQSVVLEKGDGAQVAFDQLAALSNSQGGGFSATEIKILAWLTLRGSGYKIGEYELDARTSMSTILSRLARGEITQRKIRIAEGKTWREIKKEFAKADLEHDAQNLSMSELVRAVGIVEPADAMSIEGLIFPDTYLYRKGERETAVLKRAHELLNKKLDAVWAKRSANLPYASRYEVVKMASIIEKETGVESDRPMVAAVFVNRLRLGMMLQTDPAVIYGVGEGFDGDLTTQMMRTDTPYNTYTRHGLPPTPIATASMASMEAAIKPADSDVLYFVGRGDGSSEFNRDLAQHNAAVRKYILKQ